MIRVLIFLVTLFSFSFTLEIHAPLFPNGESFKDVIVNEAIGKKVLFSNSRKISFINKDWSDFRINLIDIDKKKIFFQLNDGFINNIAMAKDSSYIAYEINVDYIKPIILKIFDIKTKKIIQTFPLENKLKSLSISPDGKYIVCLSEDNKILSFSVDEKKLKSIISLEKIKYVKVSVSNKYIAIKKNKFISLHSIQTGQEIKSFKYDYLGKFDISKDDKYILFYDYKNVKIWDIKNKNIISNFIVSDIKDIKFMNNSNKIIYVENDRLKIFDIKKEKNIFSLKNDNLKKIDRLFLLKNDRKILVNNQLLVDLKTFKIENIIDGLNCLNVLNKKKACFLEESKIVFSIDDGKGIKAWNLKENSLEYIIDKEDRINDMILDKKKKYLIFSSNKNLKIWDIEEQEIINKYQDKNSTIQDLSISDSGKLIAFKVDNKIKIIDFKSLKLIQEIEYPFEVSQFRFIEDRYIVLGNYKKIDIFDIKSAQKINSINSKKNNIYLYRNSHYCHLIHYSKNYEEEKREIRETLTNQVVLLNIPQDEYIYSIEDNNIYTYCEDTNKSYIWDLKEEKKIREIKDKSFSATNDRKSIIIRDGDEEEIKKIFYNNDYWAIFDYKTNKLYRYSNKNFILDANYQPLLPKLQEVSKDNIEIFFDTKDIKLTNNEAKIINIQVKNISDKTLYWIEPTIEDENFTLNSNSIILLKPHEIKTIALSIFYNKSIEKTVKKSLEFILKIFNKPIERYNLNLEIESKPYIKLVDVKLGNDFTVKIKNLTDKKLTNIQVLVSDGNETAQNIPIRIIDIEANSIKEIELYKDKNFGYKWSGYDLDINLSAEGIRNHIFHKHVDYDILSVAPLFILILLSLLFFLFVILYFIYIGLYNLNLNKIMQEADKIFEMPLKKFPYYRKFLKRRMNKNYYELYFSYVLENDLERVSKFFEINNEEKAQLFSEKVNGKLQKIDKEFFEVKLDKNFEIKVKKILLYFPKDANINKVYKILENKKSEGIFIISRNEKEQKIFSESIRLRELKNIIATSPRNLKMFLLQKNHSLTLSKILALKLNRKNISPYRQTKYGVQNESYFFGREKILYDITEREPSNYLIVGARQIGKTSILLALERIFKSKNELEVIRITLSSASPIRKIALKLNMDRDSTLENIEEYILNSNKPYIFLIDEVDGFIKSEGQDSYKILDTFRSLTQEGKAYFIMAGFWELYYQATYDYHSPIKNFGEIITVDKLEDDACVKLLLEPMSALNLSFKNLNNSSNNDAVFIINSLGKRANLIATVANEIVENLDSLRFEINNDDIRNALNSRKVLANFNSWQKLTDSKFKSYIDKFIVYHTIGLDSFIIRKIINLFKKIGVEKVTIDEIKESLDRLELSYILVREGKSYFYTIPLFQNHLQREDIKAIFDGMVDEFRQKYN